MPWGRCQFKKLPFGIAPALEICQREIDRLFEGMPLEIIVDNFLIHGKDQMEFDQELRLVLDRSHEVVLKSKLEEIQLRIVKISYIGHLPTSQGLKPGLEKIHA